MEKKWHADSIDEALEELKSNRGGISEAEAKARLERFGLNQIVEKGKASFLKIFARQFINPLVYILVFSSLVKFLVGNILDGSVLAGTIVIMTLIGFFQESRAAQAMEALKKMTSPKSRVRRDGKIAVISSELVVPGDIIIFESGDFISADSRLIEVSNLKINESSLTGESFPIQKHTNRMDETLTIADRRNMVFRGTSVAYGKGTALVVETGMKTQIGKIAQAIGETKPVKTPLQKSIHTLGNWMLLIVFFAILIFIGISFYHDLDLIEIFMLSVSAAVAAIPEGLPVAVTVVLATGMTIMAKRYAVIRRMMAVETLGSTTIICSDKTGTLTENLMTVRELYTAQKRAHLSGEGNSISGEFSEEEKIFDPNEDFAVKKMLVIGSLCNDALISKESEERCEVIGDPTEGALLVAAAKAKINIEHINTEHPRIGEIPFQSENLYMATLHLFENEKTVLVKGSPEKLLHFSSSYLKGSEVVELDASMREKIKADFEALAKKTFRLIAVAYTPISGTDHLKEEDFKEKLIYVGVFAMYDPPRKEAVRSIELCKQAGMRVVMATGDNKLTAAAIADQLGIESKEAVTGEELAKMSDDELEKKIKTVGVFARIEPKHKLRIVQAFQKLRHIVAMTGDGVNDAPALEAADIGIAMGIMGTEVAKESSDMVLADDNFASIVAAVEEGRAIFNRLRNVAAFLLTTCFGELLGLISCVALLGLPPLLPLQILWINLVTGVILAVPLGLEPKIGNELKMPPRDPRVGLLYRGMVHRILYLSLMLGFSIYFLFLWGLNNYNLELARTMVFSAVVIFKMLVALQMRSDEIPLFKLGLFKNRYLIYSICIALAAQIALLYIPYVNIPFQIEHLTFRHWGILLIPPIVILIIEDLRKRISPSLFSKGKVKKS
ncbi:MAG: HAD-IC family P-type ATPase [Chlamydiales bacterium]|nr:HAD-IC family P-type ATPase [Chlamydiales bacterium]